MNIITCLVLNMPYNVSKVIFEYMAENARVGSTKYIMYPRFIQMLIDDQFKDIQKSDDDVLGLRNMTAETITRLDTGPEPRVKRMICRINNPAYAPENDAWRHENINSKNENEKMNEMVEKKTRWWFVKDGKRKRPLKTSPVLPIPKEPTPNIIVKVDETVLDPSEVLQQGAHLLNQSLEIYLKRNEEVAAQKDQSTSVPTEGVKETEPEGVARDDSSEADDESTETETELDLTTLVVTGVIPRNVRARKDGATLSKDQGGKKEKHVATSQGPKAETVQHAEVPKEPEVRNVEVPEVEVT
ncbi:hypothetical protein Hanom_Chr02g00161331 [Helianthus anomalus]